MDGSIDGIGPAAPVETPQPPPRQENPAPEQPAPPTAEDSGKTLDLYV